MNDKKLPIRIRPATQDDIGFIFNSWLKSYRNSHFAKFITNTVYYENHHKVIEQLVKDNEVKVACNENDPNQLYGYICAGRLDGFFVCHYIYVKHSFRAMGIGKSLLNSFNHDADTASIYTAHTRICDRLAPKFNFVYIPYLAFKPESENE